MHKRVLLILISLVNIAYADISPEMQKSFNQTVTEAKEWQSDLKSKNIYKNIDISSYSSDPEAVKNPTETKYYKNSSAIKTDAAKAFQTDTNSKTVQTSFINTPEIDENSEMMKKAKLIAQNAKEISEGKSTAAFQCVDKPEGCHTETKEQACQKSLIHDFECTESPSIKFEDKVVKEDKIVYLNNTIMPTKGGGETSITVDEDTKTLSYAKVHFHLTHGYHCNITYTAKLNGHTFGKPSYVHCNAEQRSHHKWIDDIEFSDSFDDMQVLKGTLSFTLSGGGIVGTVSGQLNTKEEHHEIVPDITWINTCAKDVNDYCTKIKKKCIEPAATKTIDGHDVYLDCWKFADTFECGNDNDDTCKQYSSCDILTSKCTLSIGEFCILQDYTMSCTTQECDSKRMLCGAPGFCQDGSCFKQDKEEADKADFQKTISGLSGAAQAGEDSKEADGSLTIFNGKSISCSIAVADIYNCCSTDGNIINHCSTDEMALRKAKLKDLVVDLGTYCSNEVVGICLEHKKGNCVFDQVLAKVIQEQGRKQLKIPLGPAKHPNCRGLTPEELQKINWEEIDFSEYYKDIENKMNLPTKDEIIEKIKEKMKG